MQLALTKFVYVFSFLLLRYCCILYPHAQHLNNIDGNVQQFGFEQSGPLANAFASFLIHFEDGKVDKYVPGEHFYEENCNSFQAFSPLYAQSEPICYAKVNFRQGTKPSNIAQFKAKKEYYKMVTSDNEDQDEDEDLISFKKCLKIGNYFTSFLFTQPAPLNFHSYIKECLSFCKHFSYSSSCRYIVLRVIRI